MASNFRIIMAAFMLTVVMPEGMFAMDRSPTGLSFNPRDIKGISAGAQKRRSMLFGCPGLEGDANITCKHEKLENKLGQGIDCTEKVPVHTKAFFLNCQAGYGLVEDYQIITCKFPGKWDNELFTCEEKPTEATTLLKATNNTTNMTTTKKPTTTTKLTTKLSNTTATLVSNTSTSMATAGITVSTANVNTATTTTPATAVATAAVTSPTAAAATINSMITTPSAVAGVATVSTLTASAVVATVSTLTAAAGVATVSMLTAAAAPAITAATDITSAAATTIAAVTSTVANASVAPSTTTAQPTNTTTNATTATPQLPPLYERVEDVGIIKRSAVPKSRGDAVFDCNLNGAQLLVVDTDAKRQFLNNFIDNSTVFVGAENKKDVWTGAYFNGFSWVNAKGSALPPSFRWANTRPASPVGLTPYVLFNKDVQANWDVGVLRLSNKAPYICEIA